MLKTVPVQLPETGVTEYVAVCTEFEGLVSVPLILVPLPATPPVRPPVTAGAGQVKVVPEGTTPFVTFAGVEVNEPPLQIASVIPVTDGFGSIVNVTVKVGPVQLPDVGVTVYIAVCEVFVMFVSSPLMTAPVPAAPPVKPDPEGADQA
jgi:hypothetical protein